MTSKAASDSLQQAVRQVKDDLAELEVHFKNWGGVARNYDGSRTVRGIVSRVVLSAQRVKELVKENSFSR